VFKGVEMNIKFKIMSFILLIIAGPVRADPNVVVGDHVLMPDQANQNITLYVDGVDLVTGFNLRAQIGDGIGPQNEPIFQDVNFGGGIWDVYPYSVMGGPVGGAEQYAQASVVFNEPDQTVISNGTLVSLSIDTTGIFSGVYSLNLAATDIGADSTFLAIGGTEIPVTITNGNISVLASPPTTLVMQEPKADANGVFTGDMGIDVVRFLWSEAVSFSQSDIDIIDEEGSPVSFVIDGNNTEIMSITFGEPLIYNRYMITIYDSVTSVATGVAIDGDDNGLPGGDAIIDMEHRLRVDVDNNNYVDFIDFAMFALKWLWSQ